MSYIVVGHIESLHDGRMVGPGTKVSNADAKQNPKLIERGALVELYEADAPERRKPKAKSGQEAGDKPAATPQKEESK